MRLIDADALIEEMKKEQQSGKYDENTIIVSDCFIGILNRQPTAYDVVLVEDMKEQIGASGEHMDNKLCEWIKRLERGGIDG